MQTDFDVAIIGGGSAGLFAGTLLSRTPNIRVGVLERLDRVGKKLLATGNGQGNLTNADLSLTHYHGDTLLAEKVFAIANGEKTTAILESIGITLCTDERGRIYPTGKQASSVLDMFRKALSDYGATEITDAEIIRISPIKGGLQLTCKNGKAYTAKKAIAATGGCSGQGMGTDGQFYTVIKSLGHTVVPVRPSLVQLKTDTAYLKNLKGVRIHAALCAEGSVETGDVLFTDTGVSGDTAFRLSAKLNKPERGVLTVDFLPEFPLADLTALLQNKYRRLPNHSNYELLCTLLHKQIIKNLLRYTGVSETARTEENAFLEIAPLLKRFPLQLKGTAGFAQSQVTKGGVPAKEVHPETLESKYCPGLYLAGELLNVDGDCGGYNLQWAFSSAAVAAESALRALEK